MDWSYAYPLTWFMPSDGDHYIEAEVTMADESKKTLRFPDPSLGPALRFRHYERLAAMPPAVQENDSIVALLPLSIAKHVVAQEGAKAATVKFCLHYLQRATNGEMYEPFEMLGSSSIEFRDPKNKFWDQQLLEYKADVYEGKVAGVIKVDNAAESAAPSSGNSATPPPSANSTPRTTGVPSSTGNSTTPAVPGGTKIP